MLLFAINVVVSMLLLVTIQVSQDTIVVSKEEEKECMPRKLSDEGLKFIKDKEGVVHQVYDDGFGILTAGVGHQLTYEEKRKLRKGSVIGEDQVDLWLKKDVERAEDAVNNWVISELSQEGFDALVSFVFNVGVSAFKRSTLLKRLNQGKIEAAADEFNRWVFAKNKKLPGLVARRHQERELFLKGEMEETTA